MAALILGGCTGGGGPRPPPASTITVSDGNVTQPVARMTLNLGESEVAPVDRGGHAIEAGFTRGSGSSSQALPSNYVALSNQRFNAPASLSYDFTFTYIDIAYRYRTLSEFATLGVEAFAGLASAELDLTVASATQRASESIGTGGFQAGLGGIWRLRPGTSVHLRALWFWSGDDQTIQDATRFEAYVMQALHKNVTARVGYSWWSMDSPRGETVSPIKVEFRGPTIGLELMF